MKTLNLASALRVVAAEGDSSIRKWYSQEFLKVYKSCSEQFRTYIDLVYPLAATEGPFNSSSEFLESFEDLSYDFPERKNSNNGLRRALEQSLSSIKQFDESCLSVSKKLEPFASALSKYERLPETKSLSLLKKVPITKLFVGNTSIVFEFFNEEKSDLFDSKKEIEHLPIFAYDKRPISLYSDEHKSTIQTALQEKDFLTAVYLVLMTYVDSRFCADSTILLAPEAQLSAKFVKNSYEFKVEKDGGESYFTVHSK